MRPPNYLLSASVITFATFFFQPPSFAGDFQLRARLATASHSAKLQGNHQALVTTDLGSLEKLDTSLRNILEQYSVLTSNDYSSILASPNVAASFEFIPPEAIPYVLMDVVFDGDPTQAKTALESLGFRTEAIFLNDIGGWLPINQLVNLLALPNLRLARASLFATHAGVVQTQGDFAQRSDVVRMSSSVPGLTGSGVIVGVLSDSFDCYSQYQKSGLAATGPGGYASHNGITTDAHGDIVNGDLPSSINILSEQKCFTYVNQPTQEPFADEGRALLQIVHDIAPGAGLAFNAASSEAGFASGIVALSNAGAKVIVDDVGYFDEPYFQDGLIAQAVNQVAANGVAYFSSAGNDARYSYENQTPAFTMPGPASGPGAGESFLNMDASGNSSSAILTVSIPPIPPGALVGVLLEWDQPYVTGAPGSPGAANQLDLCLTDASAVIQSCSGINAVGADPVRILVPFRNLATNTNSTAAQQVGFAVGLASGPTPKLIKLTVVGGGLATTINNFPTNSSTLQGHPAALGAAAIAAVDYFITPRCGTTPPVPEPYSSAGGGVTLFDTKGQRLASPTIRQKPDFAAPDHVLTSFFGSVPSSPTNTATAPCQNSTSYPGFRGTSAAAPHAAAVAALLFQANSSASPNTVINAMRQSTTAFAPSQSIFTAGTGLLQADQALNAFPLPALVPSPPVASPTSSGNTGGGGSLPLSLLLALLTLGLVRLTGTHRCW